ncbi:MAG: hypothetical protein K6F46_08875 [Desulfovibrio sp.]|nr:hypothetical protein [Desulfovibrio sp.]
MTEPNENTERKGEGCIRVKDPLDAILRAEPNIKVIAPEQKGSRITVTLQPQDIRMCLHRPKTVRQLLAALDLAEETALVARNGELLTPDRHIWPDEDILVRKVTSSG